MVNQVILDYLKKNSGQYGLEDLKKKILSRGYPQADLDEAVKILGLDKPKAVQPEVKPVAKPEAKPELKPKDVKKSKGIKWMKIAGIIGIIFLIFNLASLVGLFFVDVSNVVFIEDVGVVEEVNEGLSKPFFIIAIVLIYLLIFLSWGFFYGFVKMGKHVDSKLLRLSSWFLFIFSIFFLIMLTAGLIMSVFSLGVNQNLDPNLISLGGEEAGVLNSVGVLLSLIPLMTILLIILIAFLFFIASIISGNLFRIALVPLALLMILSLILSTILTGSFSLAGISSSDSVLLTENNALDLYSIGGTLGLVFLLIFLLILFFVLLFFVGLITIGKEVKFARIAGIIGILLVLASVAGVLVVFLSSSLLTYLFFSEEGVMVSRIINISFGVLAMLALLFGSLALFNASKKFENQ